MKRGKIAQCTKNGEQMNVRGMDPGNEEMEPKRERDTKMVIDSSSDP